MLYSMKYVVENFNISAKTLRFYEEQGILPTISRDEKGHRVYNEQQIDWLSFIRCLKETGMPLSKIKEYKELYESGNSTFLQREEMLIQHKLEVQKKIDESLKHLEEINYKIAMYELQKEEVGKNPNYNFKCHGLEIKNVN
ncbi:MerR family transcriptional regulator [Priestia megaterium]|uniref:MerR family transcriptional regulator n=1 Tax=Priestia megaterium TaxID=1404 RepID=A0ABD4WWJ1_PRIMG|nr:MerR family transcriptional regulator [Priestia megaterium]MBV6737745.1 MerR family transcriptional regulator [Priestia megaterium]MDD9784632.1 MerR family transcriptional regulator [Priestia megaterium]QLC90841.1 MerR family transcriptional regulator [Priestia megaterium]